MQHTHDRFLTSAEKVLPWLLPALLLFSRALADLTVVLVGLIFLYHSYRGGDWQWAKQAWFRLALLFWCYLLLINLPFSIDTSDSLKYALTFIRWPLFSAALAYWLFNNDDRKRSFILSLLLVSVLVVLDTGWQYLFGVDWFGISQFNEDRLTGPFRNPVPGTLMLRVWFIALFAGLLLHGLRLSSQMLWFTLVTLLTGIVFMFITGERMAFLLFSAATLLTLVGLFASYPEHSTKLLMGAGAALMIFTIMMQLAPDTTERSVHSIFSKLGHFAASDYGLVFNAAWQAWQEYPWFGSGIHTYREVCEQMGVLAETGMGCTHPHNLYLQLGAETGVVGVLMFTILLVGIYLTVLMPLFRAKHWYPAALCLSVLSVSFWPLTGGISVLNNWVGALVWLGVGWVLAASARPLTTQLQPITGQGH